MTAEYTGRFIPVVGPGNVRIGFRSVDVRRSDTCLTFLLTFANTVDAFAFALSGAVSL